MVEIKLFGAHFVSIGGQAIERTPMKSVLALLFYLAEEGVSRHPHLREQLSELLWPGMPPTSGRKNLRQTLYELNKLLRGASHAPVILATRQSIGFNSSSPIDLDTQQFENFLKGRTIENYRKALDCYQGDFLADFYLPGSEGFERWASNRREYYRRRFRETLHTLFEIDPENRANYARQLVENDPLDEEAVRKLMAVRAESGARSEALRTFENFRLLLEIELGIEPQIETLDLYRQIAQDQATQAKPSRTRAPMIRLPRMPSRFIGRRSEVERIKSYITDPAHRLVNLFGPGGVGKTRLAIQAASELEGYFSDGIFFTSAAPLYTLEELVSEIAITLNLSFYAGEPHRNQLLGFLEKKDTLLILDNFENLTEAVDLLLEILSSAPGTKLLITSRVRLNVTGEQVLPVAGLPLPGLEVLETWGDPEIQALSVGALNLFCEHARRVKPDFKLSKNNVSHVLDICQLVNGSPLGIVLAAAWLVVLTPEGISAEIRRSLDFLQANWADLPDRQRSMRAVFDTTWSLLTEVERAVLMRLCVFAGSFSREAALHVSGGTLSILLSLANKSCLQATGGDRFQLHELMRQYGFSTLETLDDDAFREARDKHAEYFADFVAAQSARMRSAEQRSGIELLKTEFHTNIKAAFEWLVDQGRWDLIIEKMALGLYQFAPLRFRVRELITWLGQARYKLISELQEKDRLAYAIIGTLEIYCEEVSMIFDLDPKKKLRSAWKFVSDHSLSEAMEFWFIVLADLYWKNTREPGIGDLLDHAVDRVANSGDLWKHGVGLLHRIHRWDELDIVESEVEKAWKIFERLGTPHELGHLAKYKAQLASDRKRPLEEIADLDQQADQFYAQVGANEAGIDNAPRVSLASVYFSAGLPEQGFKLLQEQRRHFEELGNRRLLASLLNWESQHAVRYSTYDHALETRALSQELSEKIGIRSDLAWNIFELGEVHRVFGNEGKALEHYARAGHEFEEMNMADGFGFMHRAHGDIALRRAQYPEALERYRRFLMYAEQVNHRWGMAQAHGKLALVHAFQERSNEARQEMYSVVETIRGWWGNPLFLMALPAEAICLVMERRHKGAIELTDFVLAHLASWNETKQLARTVMETASEALNSDQLVRAAIENSKRLKLESLIHRFKQEGANRFTVGKDDR